MTVAALAQSDRARLWLGALLVFMLSCCTMLSAFANVPVLPDETTIAWQAKLALEGLLPYRDYFAYKPPLAIYLPTGLFAIFGASLGALRIFFVATLAVTTVLLYCLCVRTRMGAVWAGCAALMLPALFVPYWPVASTHWLALAFGLAALLCVAKSRLSWRAAFASGVLAALAGLCVQTHGVLFAGLLAIRLVADPATRTRGVLFVASAGIAAPLLLALGALWWAGILLQALSHVVLWPLQYYRQPGGFNDAVPQAALEAVSRTTGSPQTALAAVRWLWGAIPAVLVTGVPSWGTLGSILMWRRGQRGPRATFALLGSVMLWLVFSQGRTDQVHLILLAPIFLYLLVQHVDWDRGALGVRWMRVGLAVAVLLMLRWPMQWLQEPPSPAAVLAVDQQWKAEGLPTLMSELPGASNARSPVLYLGSYGSAFYLYWAPVPPPVDWLLPPTDRYNSPEEFQRIADFARTYEVPYIVLQLRMAEAWTRDPSPVRDVLREQYQHAFDTSWGTAYCRLDAVVPSTGAAVCDLPRPSP